jgi:hypothetical protein
MRLAALAAFSFLQDCAVSEVGSVNKLQPKSNHQAKNEHIRPAMFPLARKGNKPISVESSHLRVAERTVSPLDLLTLEPQEVGSDIRRSPVELVYHLIETTHPTAREIQREYFLLDCD